MNKYKLLLISFIVLSIAGFILFSIPYFYRGKSEEKLLASAVKAHFDEIGENIEYTYSDISFGKFLDLSTVTFNDVNLTIKSSDVPIIQIHLDGFSVTSANKKKDGKRKLLMPSSLTVKETAKGGNFYEIRLSPPINCHIKETLNLGKYPFKVLCKPNPIQYIWAKNLKNNDVTQQAYVNTYSENKYKLQHDVSYISQFRSLIDFVSSGVIKSEEDLPPLNSYDAKMVTIPVEESPFAEDAEMFCKGAVGCDIQMWKLND